ncbi:MAG: hypothetical protein AABZ44_00380 [Elusimicrobiota bacterium]
MKVNFSHVIKILPHEDGLKGLAMTKSYEAAIELAELLETLPDGPEQTAVLYDTQDDLFGMVRQNSDLNWPSAAIESALRLLDYQAADLAFLDDATRRQAVAALKKKHTLLEVDYLRLQRRVRPLYLIERKQFDKLAHPLGSLPGSYIMRQSQRLPRIYEFHISNNSRSNDRTRALAFLIVADGRFVVISSPENLQKTKIEELPDAPTACRKLGEILARSAGDSPVNARVAHGATVSMQAQTALIPEKIIPPVNLFDPGKPLDDKTFKNLVSAKPAVTHPMVCATFSAGNIAANDPAVLDQAAAVAIWQRVQGPLYDPDFIPSASRIWLSSEAYVPNRDPDRAETGGINSGVVEFRALCSFPDIYKS